MTEKIKMTKTAIDRTRLSASKRELAERIAANEATGPSIFDKKPNVERMRQLRWAKMQKSQEMVITARRAIWELAEWIDVACAGDQRKINYICDLLDRALGLHSHGFDYWMSELLNTVTNRVESRAERNRSE